MFWALAGFLVVLETAYYDQTITSHDQFCKRISKRGIRVLEYRRLDADKDYDPCFIIQYQTPITRRWKNYLCNPGIDYWCCATYKTREEAVGEVKNIIDRATPVKYEATRVWEMKK